MEARLPALIGITEPTAAPTTAAADLRAALERHHAESMGWAMVCCGFDRAEATDVLQDAYLKVLDGRAVFRGESAFRTWFFGVVRRTASEHRRQVFRRLVSRWRDVHDELPAEAADPDGQIDHRTLAGRLRRALESLPVRQRQVLHLVFHDDLTVEAAAAIMGISVGTARTHYARGKARIRVLLQEGLNR